MRRARIKVQATVPVRRKAVQPATPADSEKTPPVSDSVSDVEKTIPVKDIKLEKFENARENKTETEKLTESTVQLKEEPGISLSTPKIIFTSETQNKVQEKRSENIEEGGEESHVLIKKEIIADDQQQREIVKVTENPFDSVINKEPNSVGNQKGSSLKNKEIDSVTEIEADSSANKEFNNTEFSKETNVETEVENAEISKQVEVLKGSKDGDLSAKKQTEKEIPETSNPHVESKISLFHSFFSVTFVIPYEKKIL